MNLQLSPPIHGPFLCVVAEKKRLRPYANTIKIHKRISDTETINYTRYFTKQQQDSRYSIQSFLHPKSQSNPYPLKDDEMKSVKKPLIEVVLWQLSKSYLMILSRREEKLKNDKTFLTACLHTNRIYFLSMRFLPLKIYIWQI